MKTIKMFKLTVLAVLAIMFAMVFVCTSYGAEPTKAAITKDLKAVQYELNLVNTEFRKYATLKNHYQAIADVMAKEIDRLKAKGNQLKSESDRLVRLFREADKAKPVVPEAEKEAKKEPPKPVVIPKPKNN